MTMLFEEGELAPVPERLAVEALAIWNELAPGAGWPAAKFLTTSRRAALKRAITDYGGIVGWRTHLAAASHNDFLTGKTARKPGHENWRPDLDWFLKPANVLKVLEHKFPPNTGGMETVAAPKAVNWRARLERYQKGKFWHVATEGARPEDPGPHKAPEEMIEAWRKRYGVTGVKEVAAPESLEERLRATIVSYRRVGQYADANRIEQRLAVLEGRPAVEVAAPGAESPDRPPQQAPGKRDTARAVDVIDYNSIPEGEDFGNE